MANEAQVRASLSIVKGNKVYPPPRNSFSATVTGIKGPTPGAIIATTDGTDINLSGLDTPGLTYIKNEDDTNTVHLGVYNPDQAEFYPVLSLKAGEGFVVRLDPLINQEEAGTGTGTTGQLNTLRVKADNAPCQVLIEAHDD